MTRSVPGVDAADQSRTGRRYRKDGLGRMIRISMKSCALARGASAERKLNRVPDQGGRLTFAADAADLNGFDYHRVSRQGVLFQ